MKVEDHVSTVCTSPFSFKATVLSLIALLALQAPALLGQTAYEWVGVAGGNVDDMQDSANWSPVGVPTISDTVTFNSSANKEIFGSNLSADSFIFNSKTWVFKGSAQLEVGDTFTVSGGNVNFYDTAAINIGSRTVTFDIEANRTVDVTGSNGAFVPGVGVGNVVKNGEGTLRLNRGWADEVGTFTVNGGILDLEYDVTTDTYVLANGSTLLLSGNQSFAPNSVSGEGEVRITGGQKFIAGDGHFSHSGDVTVDSSTARAFLLNTTRDLSGHGGNFKMLNNSTIWFQNNGDLTINALDGDAGSSFDQVQSLNATLRVGAGGNDGIYAGTLKNSGGTLNFEKIGSGVQVLSGANTYSGTTAVSEGTLLMNGDQLSVTGAINVASGATFGGSGELAGAITLSDGAALAPGGVDGLGSLTVHDLTLQGAIQFHAVVAAETTGQYSQLVLAAGGTFVPGTSLNLSFDDSAYSAASGAPIVLIETVDAGADCPVQFNGLPEGAQIVSSLGGHWTISYVGGDGNDVTLRYPTEQVGYGSASAVTDTSATLESSLVVASGTGSFTLFYGATDGGQEPANWAHSIELGSDLASGTYSTPLTGLSEDTSYYYVFRFVHSNSSETWGWSSGEFGTRFASGAAPTNLVVAGSWDQINLSWQEGFSSESGFTIERSTSSDFSENLVSFNVDGGDSTSASDTTTLGGVTYYYRVAAVNDAGSSDWSVSASGASEDSVVTLTEITLTESSVFDLQEETQKMALRGTRTASGGAKIAGVDVPLGQNNPLYDYGVPTDSSWYVDSYNPDFYSVTKFRESYLHPFDFGNGVVKDLRIVPVYMHSDEGSASSWIDRILLDLAYSGEVSIDGTTYIVEVVQGVSPLYTLRLEYPGYFDGAEVGVVLYNKATGVRHPSLARLKEIDGAWYSFESNVSGEQLTVSRIDGVATMTIDIGEFWSDDFTFTSGDFSASNGWQIDLSTIDFSSGSALIPAADYTFTSFNVYNKGLNYQILWHGSFSTPYGSFSLQAGENANFTFGQRADVYVYETANYARDVHGLYEIEAIDFQVRDADLGGAVVPYQPDAGSQDNRCRLVSYQNSEGGSITTNWKSHGCGWNGVWGWYTDYREYGLSNRKFIIGTDPNPPAVYDTRTVSFACNMPGLYGQVEGSTTINVRNESFGIHGRFYDFDHVLSGYPDFEQLLPTLETRSPMMAQTATESAWSGLPPEMADTFAACYEFEIQHAADDGGEYTFHLQAQGVARLYIDGELVIENVSPDSKTDVTAMVVVSAQQRMHARLEYYHNTGPAALSLYATVFTYPYYSGGAQFDPAPGSSPAYLFNGILPADIVPNVQVSSPVAPVTLTAPGADLPVALTATHPDGTPQIEYFVDGHKVATDVAAPYGVTLQDLPVGASVVMRCVDPFGFGHLMTVDCTVIREALPDWMSRQGLAGGNADSDGDGVSDANEYEAGTDPWVVGSVFQVGSLEPKSGNYRINWKGVSDGIWVSHYQVKQSINLIDWVDCGDPVPVNVTGTYELDISCTGAVKFFRVESVSR